MGLEQVLSEVIGLVKQNQTLSDSHVESIVTPIYSVLDFVTSSLSSLEGENDLPHLQQLSSELYNSCRAATKKSESAKNDVYQRHITILRYCACLILHSSTVASLKKLDDSSKRSKRMIQQIPDVLRAYLHTAKYLKKYDLATYYRECFAKGLSIIDDVEPCLKVVDTGMSTIC